MSDQFLAEIRIFAGNFAPVGWAMCQGQTLSISQYSALFSLLGTAYGGNGTSNFQLPDLQGRVPMHFGNGAGLTPRVLGEEGGEEAVTLTASQMPAHSHTYNCGSGSKGETNVLANQVNCDEQTGTQQIYATTTDNSVVGAGAVALYGSGQPHENRQPYLALNYIIALSGIYPARG